jgi:hypothetical protein
MKLKVDQIALCPEDPAAAIELLTAMGAADWARDHVVAHGTVFGEDAESEGVLAYNYELGSPREFEVLNYVAGDNWMDAHPRSVSHFGMHCTAKELVGWKQFFRERDIRVAQELLTDRHTNPRIAGQRRYHYCIFDTRAILGVDLKFIVRYDHDKRPTALQHELPL